ncbi:MAG TPA: hypothetical protein VGK10_06340 [Prolixibacteraceae bacterium]|jgi:hypothetical protein
MRKLAANYLVSDTGEFLKNGMAIAQEDGCIVEYIDTKGDLEEVEQLIFHNGLLMAACKYTKINTTQTISAPDNSFRLLVHESISGITELSIQQFIDLGKQLQLQFPQMKVPAIMNEISEVLLAEGGFIKKTIPGIYLLTGVNLVELLFTPRSRLKKIL